MRLIEINCCKQIFSQICAAISEMGVCTLRADLAAVRASIAYAALSGDVSVNSDHVTRVLPLVLAHRVSRSGRPPARRPKPPEPEPSPASESGTPEKDPPPVRGDGLEHIFSPKGSKSFASIRISEAMARAAAVLRLKPNSRALSSALAEQIRLRSLIFGQV